ncbi:MAG TPA: PEP-CTERM sorting domain-containing protein [Gemmataceae bacterium]|jgi:hypothetical protein|nr:PEP-CTERM sorting domain-containing protein [Gemmataceae bacterium]
MMRGCCKIAVFTLLGALAMVGRTEAGLIPTNVSITPDAGNFRWTYAVVVTTDVKVNPGDYFTIYDFDGLIGGSMVAPTKAWSMSTPMTGVTPAGTTPTDDPHIPNLTFTYNGPPINGQQGLGNFSAISTFGDAVSSNFTSISHRQVDGRSEANITSTDVPVPGAVPQTTPEPATLGMLGIGLPVLGLLRLLRRRKK